MTDAASSRPWRTAKEESSPESPLSESPASDTLSFREKCLAAHDIASALFELKPGWPSFFREILGVNGAVVQLFLMHEERKAFEKTEEFAHIQEMLAQLQRLDRLRGINHDDEPTRVITVRIPKSVHLSLQQEARAEQISMNKLCVAKLVQALDDDSAEDSDGAASPPVSDNEESKGES